MRIIVYTGYILIYSHNSIKQIRYRYIKGKRREIGVKILKLFESILKAATALVAVVISIVKIIDNMDMKKT